MAYQKQIYQDGVTEYTEELFEHMDDGIFGAYPVQLIAISDTAPSECVENDKYYNTSTKKIYTATGTNTWGTNGETPLEDTAYWLISENGSYAWNGTDLVSIGGGKAEVVISDEEPEEGKLWVDTAEIPTIAGRDRLVNVSNEVDDDYRVNFIKGKNLFDKNNYNVISGYFLEGETKITSAQNPRIVWVECKGDTTYTIQKVKSARFKIATTEITPAINVNISNIVSNDNATELSITTSANAKYLCVYCYQANEDTLTLAQILNTLIIQEGSSIIIPSIYVDDEMLVSKNIYSTSEVVIGEWLGKPLYRSVVDTGQLSSTDKNVNHNIANVDMIVNINGFGWLDNNTTFMFPITSKTNINNQLRVYADRTKINLTMGSDCNFSKSYVILEYTKTTD